MAATVTPVATREGRPPGPPGTFLRLLRPALSDPLRLVTDIAAYGGVATIRRDTSYLVSAPDAIGRIFQDNHFNYVKGDRYIRALEPLFGRGLLTAEGDHWRRQRRLIQPVFHRANHDAYAAVIVAETRERLDRWQAAARAGTAIDLREEMTALTLAILMRAVFGEDGGDEVERVGEAFLVAHHEMDITAAFLPVRLPRWVPTPGRRRFAAALATIDAFIARMLRERDGRGPGGTDFLARLLAARDPESGEPMAPGQVRDEVITMLAAGHDTVTEALTWTLWLVAQHPEEDARVHEEASLALGARPPAAHDLGALPYVTQVVEESMRLYPPVWGLMRTAVGEDVLEGYRIPAGARLVVCPWVTHRSPALWPEPERFRPDRFAPGADAGRHRFAYFPFGAGPRQCVGAQFAMLEVPLVAAMIWREFRIELVPGEPVRPLPRVSLRADRPVWARVVARASS